MLSEGKRIRTRHLDVRLLASPLAHPRVGIIVPKHRHTAVLRNRLKRRLRELVRCELLPIVTTGDWVIRTRPEAYDASFDALRDDVRKIGGR